MEILAFINQKGGTAKTTTAHNVGAGLMKKGKKVLYIDLDPQANLTHFVGADFREWGTLEALERPGEAWDMIQYAPGGDILSASPLLASADLDDVRALAKVIKELPQDYDYIIIDTPPTQSILTANALQAATGAVITAQTDISNVSGLVGLSGTIEAAKKKNKELDVMGVVITRYSDRATINRETAEAITETARDELGAGVYKTRCRDYIAVREAQTCQKNIFDYAPKSKAAADAEALTKEIMKGRAKL